MFTTLLFLRVVCLLACLLLACLHLRVHLYSQSGGFEYPEERFLRTMRIRQRLERLVPTRTLKKLVWHIRIRSDRLNTATKYESDMMAQNLVLFWNNRWCKNQLRILLQNCAIDYAYNAELSSRPDWLSFKPVVCVLALYDTELFYSQDELARRHIILSEEINVMLDDELAQKIKDLDREWLLATI